MSSLLEETWKLVLLPCFSALERIFTCVKVTKSHIAKGRLLLSKYDRWRKIQVFRHLWIGYNVMRSQLPIFGVVLQSSFTDDRPHWYQPQRKRLTVLCFQRFLIEFKTVVVIH